MKDNHKHLREALKMRMGYDAAGRPVLIKPEKKLRFLSVKINGIIKQQGENERTSA